MADFGVMEIWLILVSFSPLIDLRIACRKSAVILDGRPLPRRYLHDLWRDRIAQAHTQSTCSTIRIPRVLLVLISTESRIDKIVTVAEWDERWTDDKRGIVQHDGTRRCVAGPRRRLSAHDAQRQSPPARC